MYQDQVYTNINDDGDELTLRTESIYPHVVQKGRHFPYILGVVDMFMGVIITLLGFAEVIIAPMIESTDGDDWIIFDKKTCYGCGIYAGVLLLITGSTFVRATFTQRNSTIHRLYHLNMVVFLYYLAMLIFFVMAYAHSWNTSDNFPDGSAIPDIHAALFIFCLVGFLFLGISLALYFDVLCCGSYPLYQHWMKCAKIVCPCFVTKREVFLYSNQSDEDINVRSNPI